MKISQLKHEVPPGTTASNESDSNADTCCLGHNFTVLSYTNRTADVYPFDESYKPMTSVPIVTGATTYHHTDGTSYILVINEALFYGKKLKHTLINPNQIRHRGIGFWDNPYDQDHHLMIEISDHDLEIPLEYKGTKLIFQSSLPTEQELNELQHIELTSNQPWNPAAVVLGQVDVKYPGLARGISSLQTCVGACNGTNIYTIKNHYEGLLDNDTLISEIDSTMRKLSEIGLSYGHNEIEYDLGDLPPRNAFVSNERHKQTSVATLAETWGIGPLRAAATLKATTQQFKRSAILPISRRYRADRFYEMKKLDGKFATDTIWADIKSLNQHKYSQIYTHKCGFAISYPLDSMTGDNIGLSLQDFVHDYGIPNHLTFDGHPSQVGQGSLFMKNVRKYGIQYHVSSPRRPEQNPAEGGIREIKRRWYRIMTKKDVPRRLWDFGLNWVCETGNITVSSSRYADGRTPIEIITGETPDISEYLDFSFYDWVTYRSNAGLGELSLGRWLGVSHKIGQLMSYWVLTEKGRVISCTTVQRLTRLEQDTQEWAQKMQKYNSNIREIVENVASVELNTMDGPKWNQLSIREYDEEFNEEFQKVINNESVKDIDEYFEVNDDYLNMEVGLQRSGDEHMERAVVKRRVVDINGVPVGVPNNNPMMDTRQFEIEFNDGQVEILPANVIAESILSQVDEDGHKQLMLDEIIDHRSNDQAIKKEDGYVYNPYNKTKRRKKTTRGWQLCVQWKDGSLAWIPLKDMKDGFPLETSHYAVSKSIQDEPAFAWWVPYALKKEKRILSKLKSKYWERTHKYGIQIPKTVEEAYAIDALNGNKLWTNAIREEMRKIKGAIRVHDGAPEELIGFQQITGHLIFDIKLGEGFRRKARFVGDGHKTKPPSSVTYSSVVSRDSVRIMLMVAALNNLDIQGADIENAYLTAPCREKVWLRGGIEFGELAGEVLIVEKALYGLKSSGAAFRSFLAETFDNMGFTSSIADPDIWMRPAVKSDGEEYYEYIVCYVDDVLGISEDAMMLMKEIQKDFKFKKDKIGPPEMYLGAYLEKKVLNDKDVWTMCSKDYVKMAVENIQVQLKKDGKGLTNRAVTPMINDYSPELDESDELDNDEITFYQEIIGMMRWAIEIGRVDINMEISLLSSYQAAPRLGHLEQLLHVVAYLKKKPKLTLYFDPSLPRIDESMFEGNDREQFLDHYRGAEEEIPTRMPKPRGRSVQITAFVDASHAPNKKDRRSYTGYVIFINRAPIMWYSKKQNTVESSAFSSEFIAMKTCVESIIGLRFKLRMFGIPFHSPADVLCDNQSVVTNSSKLESKLNKKHSSVAYHATRWAVAAGIIRVGKVPGEENLADAFTKRLPVVKREYLFGNWTY